MSDKNIVNTKKQPKTRVLCKISEIARNALKDLILSDKPAIPLYYEKAFYTKATEMGETELIEYIRSTLPVSQKATLMVEGVSAVIFNLNEEIQKYRTKIEKHGGQIEEKQSLIRQIIPPDVWLILEKHLSGLQNANNQMRMQIEITKSRLQNQEQKVSELQQENRKDPITGAMNRLAMEEDLPNEFARSKRYNRVFSIIMADIDHFKRINDTYGHTLGDEVLKIFVQRVQKALREVDIIYRYGGDEFLVLLPETNAAAALLVGERLKKKVNSNVLKHRYDPSITFQVTSSFGVSVNNDA